MFYPWINTLLPYPSGLHIFSVTDPIFLYLDGTDFSLFFPYLPCNPHSSDKGCQLDFFFWLPSGAISIRCGVRGFSSSGCYSFPISEDSSTSGLLLPRRSYPLVQSRLMSQLSRIFSPDFPLFFLPFSPFERSPCGPAFSSNPIP